MAIDLDQTPEWAALADHHRDIGDATLRDLFAHDKTRGSTMAAQAGDLYLDYSKNRITTQTVRLLVALAERMGLRRHIDAMFAGEHINVTEDRAVLHVALRMPDGEQLVVDGQDVVADVHRVLAKMGDFSDRVRSGEWKGHTGKPIRAVVNIGIGGSDLGPAMAYLALRPYSTRDIEFRFVSNVDPADITEALRDLDPETTLFIVVSKTFSTAETLSNARAARSWLLDGLGLGGVGGDRGAGEGGDTRGAGAAVARHFVAVSTQADRVAEFGIDTDNMFGFWDWVGGRYSFDSAVGLSLMVAIGREHFGEMLDGFHTIDLHLRQTPFERNLPVLLGLLSVWYSGFFGCQTQAVLPYSQYLSRFPAYLQQLCMESNGKSVTAAGEPVRWTTGEIVWGEPGTNGQHAFYQLLHQGTRLVPCDFIGFANPIRDVDGMHDKFLSNLLAQPRALAFGRTAEEVAADGTSPDVVPHKVMPGNRPSNTIIASKLTPSVLGQLVATYEHRVLTQGVIWGIDSFDQWGVELGKVMAGQLLPVLTSQQADTSGLDSSTAQLVRRLRAMTRS
jgi:glucose-6-phosphate isomerase